MERPALDEHEQAATDLAALTRLKRFGGGKLLGEMIALFLASAPERIASARGGLDTGDAAAVELALHSLKSSAGQLGAMRLQRMSQRGEQLAKAGTFDELPILMREMDAELTRVREWLLSVRDEGIA